MRPTTTFGVVGRGPRRSFLPLLRSRRSSASWDASVMPCDVFVGLISMTSAKAADGLLLLKSELLRDGEEPGVSTRSNRCRSPSPSFRDLVGSLRRLGDGSARWPTKNRTAICSFAGLSLLPRHCTREVAQSWSFVRLPCVDFSCLRGTHAESARSSRTAGRFEQHTEFSMQNPEFYGEGRCALTIGLYRPYGYRRQPGGENVR